MEKLTVGSLFAGIGGFDIGLERTGGFETRWQVEIDPFAQAVLKKHWPDCGRWDDIRTFPPAPVEGWRVDVLTGGFPCQGISSVNYRATGLADARSGLWSEYRRCIRLLRPGIVIIENVPAITFRGLATVLCDLAACGYDAQWQTLSAQAFGAPIIRERVFIVACTPSLRCVTDEVFQRKPFETTSEKQASRIRMWPGKRQHSPSLQDRVRWVPDDSICRVVDGVPNELDGYRLIGNSVCPQVVQWIGERILDSLHGS